MAQGVMTIAEQRDGEIRKVSYEVVSEGRRIADTMGQEVTALLLGSNVKDTASTLAHYGADKVLVADDPQLETYTTDAYVAVIADLVKASDPALLLLGASVQGKDLAARLAARLGVGMAQDCTVLSIEDGNLVAESLDFYGIKTAESSAALVARSRERAAMSENEAVDLAVEETTAERSQ